MKPMTAPSPSRKRCGKHLEKEGMVMGLAGIAQTTVEATNLLSQTAFQIGTNKVGQLNQVQPNQLDQLAAETDSVNISSRALELSQSTINNKSIGKK